MYIYKLVRANDKHYYIGSTQKTLKYRLKKHKDKSYECPNRRVYKYILKNGGWKDWKIEVVEHCPDLTLQELLSKENTYITECEECLNSKYAISC